MFPFVGLMKLSFISCFLIAIGVSIAIVINPLSNELQGAWIVSIMGTGLYRINYIEHLWRRQCQCHYITFDASKRKKSIMILIYWFCFCFISFCAVFFWYFAAVMYSLYKSMKVAVDNSQPHMVTELNNEHAMSENVV